MKLPHFNMEGGFSQCPELGRWQVVISPGARALEPEDLTELLIDQAVNKAPEPFGWAVNVYRLSYLNDTIVVLTRPGDDTVIVVAQAELEAEFLRK